MGGRGSVCAYPVWLSSRNLCGDGRASEGWGWRGRWALGYGVTRVHEGLVGYYEEFIQVEGY